MPRRLRFFGTPTFLPGQTLVAAIWVIVNVAGLTKFDVYSFILLNLAVSSQSAYAAPLILLARTRQKSAHAGAQGKPYIRTISYCSWLKFDSTCNDTGLPMKSDSPARCALSSSSSISTARCEAVPTLLAM